MLVLQEFEKSPGAGIFMASWPGIKKPRCSVAAFYSSASWNVIGYWGNRESGWEVHEPASGEGLGVHHWDPKTISLAFLISLQHPPPTHTVFWGRGGLAYHQTGNHESCPALFTSPTNSCKWEQASFYLCDFPATFKGECCLTPSKAWDTVFILPFA